MNRFVRVSAAAALAGVLGLSGCAERSAPTDPGQSSRGQATTAAIQHLMGAIEALPNLIEKPLGEQRDEFEKGLEGTGMTVTWADDTAELADPTNECESTFALGNGDMVALECAGVTFSQTDIEKLILGALVPPRR